MTAFYEAVGASLEIDAGAFTTCLKSFTPNSTAREALDKTCLSSTDNKEFKAAKLADLGEFQFVFDWDPSIDYFDDGDVHTWKITYPLLSGQSTAATEEFTGFITGVERGAGEVDSLIMATTTVKLDGTTYTLTAGS